MDHEGGKKGKYSSDKTKSNGRAFLAQQCFEGVELRKTDFQWTSSWVSQIIKKT